MRALLQREGGAAKEAKVTTSPPRWPDFGASASASQTARQTAAAWLHAGTQLQMEAVDPPPHTYAHCRGGRATWATWFFFIWGRLRLARIFGSSLAQAAFIFSLCEALWQGPLDICRSPASRAPVDLGH